MIDTTWPASRSAVASCQTRRSNGLGRFSTSISTRLCWFMNRDVLTSTLRSRKTRVVRSAHDLAAKHGLPAKAGPPGDGRCGLPGVEPPRYPAGNRGEAPAMDARSRPGYPRHAQKQRSFLLPDKVAVGGGIDPATLAAVEKELDLVSPGHLQAVFYDHPPRLLFEGDVTPMHHRVGEPQIAGVPALEDVTLGRRSPQAAAGARPLDPHEIPAGMRLVQPIDPHGVVRRRAAKILPPRTLRVVRVGSRIDEKFPATDRKREGEGVGVAMRGDRLITQRTCVRGQAYFVLRLEVAAEDVVTALGKHAPDREPGPRGGQPQERRVRFGSEKPARLVVQAARLYLEVAPAKENRTSGEEGAVVAITFVLREPQDERVVGIAEHGNVAAGIHDRGEILDHRLDARLVRRRKFLAVRPAGEKGDEEKIQLELLVRHRLLAVDAVGGVLQQRLPLEDRLRFREPGARALPIRPREGRGEQTGRLADEMVVCRRVERKMAVDELRVLEDRVQPTPSEPGAFIVLEHARVAAPQQLPRH